MGEDATEPLSVLEEDFLKAVSRALAFLPRAFDADLGRAENLSTSEFFTLMHLSEAPGHRLRMGDLVAATALTQGRVTQVVQRLEAKGLVERQPCPDDRRGQVAVLSAAGEQRLEAVRPVHLVSVRRRVLDRLEGFDLQALTDAVSRLSIDDQA